MPERVSGTDVENSAATDAAPAAANVSAGEAMPFGESLQKALDRAQEIAKKAGLQELTTDVVLLALVTLRKSHSRALALQLRWDRQTLANQIAYKRGMKADDLLPDDMRPKR